MTGADSGSAVARPRVLIVEDDVGVRRSVLMLFAGRGFDAIAYSTVGQALADAILRPPACLVADYRLDPHDGVGLLEALRAKGWNGPAILISGYGSDAVYAHAKAAGFALTLDKPLREHVLVDALNRLTGLSR